MNERCTRRAGFVSPSELGSAGFGTAQNLNRKSLERVGEKNMRQPVPSRV
jgi:hypothetical protein